MGSDSRNRWKDQAGGMKELEAGSKTLKKGVNLGFIKVNFLSLEDARPKRATRKRRGMSE